MLFCDPYSVPMKCVWLSTARGVDEDMEQRAGGAPLRPPHQSCISCPASPYLSTLIWVNTYLGIYSWSGWPRFNKKVDFLLKSEITPGTLHVILARLT